jgi:ParB-like chromosome segregation protein Spo0J
MADFFADEIAATIIAQATDLFAKLNDVPLDERVEVLNAVRRELHRYSPFAAEPVDCVEWVWAAKVQANDYNPNSVAPPEMKLLELSIEADGFTQPVVAWQDGEGFVVVDGFHRNRVARESKSVKERLRGYLPLAIINSDREDLGDRMASTIRHNRARGKHKVEAMSDIVVELKRRMWSDEKIGKELGMDPDEVLRLSQISGLAEMFANREFSEAWEVAESTEINEEDDLNILKEGEADEDAQDRP